MQQKEKVRFKCSRSSEFSEKQLSSRSVSEQITSQSETAGLEAALSLIDSSVMQVDLSMDDIETILNTLIYDGKVEMTVIAAKEGTVGSVDGQMKLYRGVNPVIQPTGLVKAPCGLCPVTRSTHMFNV